MWKIKLKRLSFYSVSILPHRHSNIHLTKLTSKWPEHRTNQFLLGVLLHNQRKSNIIPFQFSLVTKIIAKMHTPNQSNVSRNLVIISRDWSNRTIEYRPTFSQYYRTVKKGGVHYCLRHQRELSPRLWQTKRYEEFRYNCSPYQ